MYKELIKKTGTQRDDKLFQSTAKIEILNFQKMRLDKSVTQKYYSYIKKEYLRQEIRNDYYDQAFQDQQKQTPTFTRKIRSNNY